MNVLGLPISTFTASVAAVIFYAIAAIVVLATNCPFTRNVIYFFSFQIIAITAVTVMAVANIVYPRYRFNCTVLTLSLAFSGAAALILLGLIMTAATGLCEPVQAEPKETYLQVLLADDRPTKAPTKMPRVPTTTPKPFKPGTTFFGQNHIGNYFAWFSSLFGLGFHVVAHYFYG